jgi:acyl-CoA thioesterase
MREYRQLPPDASLEEVRAYFADDRFAVGQCDCEVLEAACGHAVCAFDIQEHHLNMSGIPMGGAIFTLADFALGIASNYNQQSSVSVQCNIEYLSVARGKRLIATADLDKNGRSLAFCTVLVHDETGLLVAKADAICARVGQS